MPQRPVGGFGQSADRAERLLTLCAVLALDRPVTLAELRDRYGLYGQSSPEAARAQFERDKRDLRAVGVPLATTDLRGQPAYRLDRKEAPREVRWTHDQAVALTVLAATVGDVPTGTALAAVSAGTGHYPDGHAGATVRVDLALEQRLLEGLAARRRVAFTYRNTRGVVARRTVEPWALAARQGLWYLTGWDVDRGAGRVYRLDRILDPPALGEPATRPHPGGLGASLTPEDRVAVTFEVPATRAHDVARIGALIVGGEDRLEVTHHGLREETALGWALRVGARIRTPAALAQELRGRLERLRAAHEGAGREVVLEPERLPVRRVALSEDRLRRLLVLPSWLAARPGVTLDEAATAFGCSREEILAEVRLLDLADVPGVGAIAEAEVDGDQIVLTLHVDLPTTRLSVVDAMRLLLLTTAARRLLQDPELTATLDGIERTLREAVGLDADAVVDVLELHDPRLPDLRRAIAESRELRFAYRGRHDDAAQPRRVVPGSLELSEGRLYVLGHDLDAGRPRSFRVDRMAEVEVGEPVEVRPSEPVPPPAYVPTAEEVEVTLAMEPAGTWLLAHLGAAATEPQADGGVVTLVPTDSPDWLVEHVLAGGGSIEVLSPLAVRRAVRARAEQHLGALA